MMKGKLAMVGVWIVMMLLICAWKTCADGVAVESSVESAISEEQKDRHNEEHITARNESFTRTLTANDTVGLDQPQDTYSPTIVRDEEDLSVWALMKQQIYNDFAPFYIILKSMILQIPPPIRTYVHSHVLHTTKSAIVILTGALGPMLSVAAKVLRLTATALNSAARSLDQWSRYQPSAAASSHPTEKKNVNHSDANLKTAVDREEVEDSYDEEVINI